jgi:hypothetical protein
VRIKRPAYPLVQLSTRLHTPFCRLRRAEHLALCTCRLSSEGSGSPTNRRAHPLGSVHACGGSLSLHHHRRPSNDATFSSPGWRWPSIEACPGASGLRAMHQARRPWLCWDVCSASTILLVSLVGCVLLYISLSALLGKVADTFVRLSIRDLNLRIDGTGGNLDISLSMFIQLTRCSVRSCILEVPAECRRQSAHWR